ncbi:MAG: NAD(P)H-dependent oxidoreductase subunit E [Candidatus Aminicenantes bacterium]|nr:NAD(P)H-dependent oxidoreductase subunit E [Candidatus Aminicenantes bacterium]NLH77456.1 NAD(P)H-dependent oxidoreductase subunit E [Acidobacteriota bacterium]
MRPSPRDLEALTARSAGRPRALIQVLQDVQDRYHWLPPEALEHVSRALGVPLVQVYGVATFYRSFSLSPRGRHVCTVCLGTACHVRGGAAVLEQFERRLGIAAGETTPDGRVTLERVNCLGACALAPLAVVDGRYHGRMTEAKAEAVLADIDKDDPS